MFEKRDWNRQLKFCYYETSNDAFLHNGVYVKQLQVI